MREERDSMGIMQVPDDAYYGAQTQRAIENFPVSDLKIPKSMIKALGMIKRSAAVVNHDLGNLDKDRMDAIINAADEVIDGKFDTQFLVDIFQTGSGTSTNMNTNEIIANRASEIMGGVVGSREPVHPNDHVNYGQSSNDVIPTAIHVAANIEIEKHLIPSLERLASSLLAKAKEFDGIVKIGALIFKMLLYSTGTRIFRICSANNEWHSKIETKSKLLSELAQGGTAVGTGINTHVEFGERIAKQISLISDVNFIEARNHFEAQVLKMLL